MNGNYKALYKVNIKRIPVFFYELSFDMMFQMDKIETETLKKRANLAIMRSMAIRTGDKNVQFQADIIEKELEKESKEDKQLSLNEFINYIEITFNTPGAINPEKISALRGFSLYQLAKEKNKAIKKAYANTTE